MKNWVEGNRRAGIDPGRPSAVRLQKQARRIPFVATIPGDLRLVRGLVPAFMSVSFGKEMNP
jgi:hypothetical protein